MVSTSANFFGSRGCIRGDLLSDGEGDATDGIKTAKMVAPLSKAGPSRPLRKNLAPPSSKSASSIDDIFSAPKPSPNGKSKAEVSTLPSAPPAAAAKKRKSGSRVVQTVQDTSAGEGVKGTVPGPLDKRKSRETDEAFRDSRGSRAWLLTLLKSHLSS